MQILPLVITNTVLSLDRNKIAIPERRVNRKSSKRKLWAANIFENLSDPCDYISNDYPYVVRRTCAPTSRPTSRPTKRPTSYPTMSPTRRPTERPTMLPSVMPSIAPTSSPTKTPSIYPSLSTKPTISPTNSPTSSMQPTSNPSSSPSHAPSIVKSLSPSISHSPTSSPTGICLLTPEDRISQITDIISNVSSSDDLNNSDSAQSKALQWILYEDSMGLCPQDEKALTQRYVMAVFYYAMNGDDWKECSQNSSSCLDNAVFKQQRNNFLSGTRECTWGKFI